MARLTFSFKGTQRILELKKVSLVRLQIKACGVVPLVLYASNAPQGQKSQLEISVLIFPKLTNSSFLGQIITISLRSKIFNKNTKIRNSHHLILYKVALNQQTFEENIYCFFRLFKSQLCLRFSTCTGNVTYSERLCDKAHSSCTCNQLS